MAMELKLNSLRLELQAEELNSTDNPQGINSLMALEEKRSHDLKNIKKRQ
jgi:hypothetical protein